MDLEEIRRREQYPAKKERYIQDREADLQQSALASNENKKSQPSCRQ
jgi:hypothetical protein